MKHKLSEMIKAKADNMDLVIILKNCQNDGDWWALKSDKEILPSFANGEYFACLPQHEEACLHWLNGGEIQERGFYNTDAFGDITMIGNSSWNVNHIFMDVTSEFRIKPRKGKQWILVNPITRGTSMLYNSEQSALRDLQEESLDWQFIEIEVEV